MEEFVIFLVLVFFFWMALKVDSGFWNIMAGFTSIGFGVHWIDIGDSFIYSIEGVILICAGIYTLGMVGWNFIQSRRE